MVKKKGAKWVCDIQPGGRGCRRYIRRFDTKIDALRFERSIVAKVQNDPAYVLPIKDTRFLSDLVEIWYKNTGSFLSSGFDTKNRLLSAVVAMGSPRLSAFNASMFVDYRSVRIEAGIAPATLNRELQTFKSMFNDLIRSGDVLKNPLESVRLIRCHQPKMQFLTVQQIGQLMESLKSSGCDVYLVALICLSTGARWGEAQSLTASDVSLGLVHYHNTKSKKSRSVPISKGLYDLLVARLNQGTFLDSYSTFSRHLEKLAFDLPAGERTHVLRHTFASHFMMAGGNILTLQKVLGHSSLDMTMKYAHLSPDYLQEVLEKNPVLKLC
jgi:site-specific recombinase XerD